MIKGIILFLALLSTLTFVNIKFSSAIKVLAFKEDEDKFTALVSILLIFIASLLWGVFFSVF